MQSISPSQPGSRRAFLRRACAAGAGALVLGAMPRARAAAWPSDPFVLGVAAGSPSADGFALWTRLAPDPLANDPELPGGVRPDRYRVRYDVATDPAMRNVVRTGHAVAESTFGYSVHVEVGGLAAARPYWYRFSCRDAESRIGRASTLPAAQTDLVRLRLGVVSCSNYEHGYFSAYRHLADEAPDYALFLGDYIYEHVEQSATKVRTHSDGVEATTLPLYRNRYAQYRLDEDLQRLHAEVPTLVTWDDHEVQNDYADRWSETFDDPTRFLQRRAAAYQAFYEHMPLRPSRSLPHGPSMRVYDRFRFGRLAEIALLDGRQFRSREACDVPPKGGGHTVSDAQCPERLDASRTMLGTEQERWLREGLARSQALWNVLAQDVMIAELRERGPTGDVQHWTDDWNGYPAARNRLLRAIHDTGVRNPIALTGDIHSYWVNDLKLDFDAPDSPVVATELVVTSVTSHPPPYEVFARYAADNPHVRYFESRRRGYMTVLIEPRRLTTTHRCVSDAAVRGASVETSKTLVVEEGRPGAVSA